MRKTSSILFIFALAFGLIAPVRARQTNLSSATLYAVDSSAYPTISALMDVFDTNGVFASGLKPESVSVIENSQAIPVLSLTEMASPLQLVVAVNQGGPLGTRDSNGFSHFQRAAQVLATWAQSRPPDVPDDYSLVSQAGPVINHAPAQDFIAGLGSFNPDFAASTSNLQSLSIAIDIVSAQTPRTGMKRAILFITPHSDDPGLLAALDPLLQRAVQERIRIFIWFIDFETTFQTTSAAAYNNLAIQTGGAMFQFSGTERFPDPEIYFSPLRRVYALTYSSRITASGEHSIAIQANLPSGSLLSNEQKIALDIQPPNPIPVTPQMQITRQPPAEDPYNPDILLPTSQEIEIIVEFTDGHTRPLTRTTLYVDGVVMDENTVEPFNKFTWDISSYTSSGEHKVVVEAVDSLGLSKTSMPTPITVTVIKPPGGITGLLARFRTQFVFGAIVLAGLILFGILLSGRIRLPSLRRAQEVRRAEADPLTQTVQTVVEETISAEETTKPKRKTNPKKTGTPKPKKDAPASFIRLNQDGSAMNTAPIPLVEKEIAFGTDPVQCAHILDDSSISSVHARLRMTDDGGYLLLDNNSIAGTWVNYELIAREGRRLMHGDMVHFGRLVYRFNLKNSPAIKKPIVTVDTEE